MLLYNHVCVASNECMLHVRAWRSVRYACKLIGYAVVAVPYLKKSARIEVIGTI